MVGQQLKLSPLELETEVPDGKEGSQEITVKSTVGNLCFVEFSGENPRGSHGPPLKLR